MASLSDVLLLTLWLWKQFQRLGPKVSKSIYISLFFVFCSSEYETIWDDYVLLK